MKCNENLIYLFIVIIMIIIFIQRWNSLHVKKSQIYVCVVHKSYIYFDDLWLLDFDWNSLFFLFLFLLIALYPDDDDNQFESNFIKKKTHTHTGERGKNLMSEMVKFWIKIVYKQINRANGEKKKKFVKENQQQQQKKIQSQKFNSKRAGMM